MDTVGTARKVCTCKHNTQHNTTHNTTQHNTTQHTHSTQYTQHTAYTAHTHTAHLSTVSLVDGYGGHCAQSLHLHALAVDNLDARNQVLEDHCVKRCEGEKKRVSVWRKKKTKCSRGCSHDTRVCANTHIHTHIYTHTHTHTHSLSLSLSLSLCVCVCVWCVLKKFTSEILFSIPRPGQRAHAAHAARRRVRLFDHQTVRESLPFCGKARQGVLLIGERAHTKCKTIEKFFKRLIFIY